MTTIVHISDTHFGTAVAHVKRALLDDIHAHAADVVLLTGDITQRARPRQFREALAFFGALPEARRLTIPGNHDIPLFDLLTRLTRPYRFFSQYISSNFEPRYVDDDVALLCLNSTRASRHKNGVLSRSQIDDTAVDLSNLRQPFKLVALHHPLVVTLPRDRSNRVRGADRALERWITAGADLFLGGHIHLPYCVPVTATDSGRTAIVLQAGTALSWRIRGGNPNSYNRIVLQRSGTSRSMQFERRDYDATTGRFVSSAVHEAAAVEGGWQLRDPEG